MTLRAGSYNANRPDWRGLVRNDGSPWYECLHTHHCDARDARDCARQALAALVARQGMDPKPPLPEGWVVFRRPPSRRE